MERSPSQPEAGFTELGYRNVHVLIPMEPAAGRSMPFDAILVAAGWPIVPPALVEQLEDRAELVMPVGPAEMQELVHIAA